MKTLIPFLLLISALKSSGQAYRPLLDADNSWCYTSNILPVNVPDTIYMGNCSYPGFTYMSSARQYTSGDTMINNIIYKIIELTESGFGTVCRFGYIREDTAARKVYFIDNVFNPEILLYNFSMQLGDLIPVNFISPPGIYESGLYSLDSIVPFYTGYDTTKAYYLNCTTCSFPSYPIEWIEGIGNRSDLIYTYSANQQGGGLFWCSPTWGFPYFSLQILTSFEHNERVYFDSCALQTAIGNPCFNYLDTCSYWNICGGIDEHSSGLFTIFPNPSSDNIVLHFLPDMRDIHIYIYDITGKILFKEQSTLSNDINLNLSGLSGGVYLVRCSTSNASGYRKLVIEN